MALNSSRHYIPQIAADAGGRLGGAVGADGVPAAASMRPLSQE